jgi:hypothetical protein
VPEPRRKHGVRPSVKAPLTENGKRWSDRSDPGKGALPPRTGVTLGANMIRRTGCRVRFHLFSLVLAALALAGCAEPVTRQDTARILAMGDSMLAWNRASGRSVADVVELLLHEPVIDRSVPGARVKYVLPISGAMGMNIAKQYRPGRWDWIIMNGGGNDLWLGCGCMLCAHKMTSMISTSGRDGAIPSEVRKLRATGARVIYLGYLRSPGVGSFIEHCKDEGDEFESRLARLAATDPGVFFVPVGDMVPYGDRSFHGVDMIHPSVKGSAAIARRVVDVITRAGAPQIR